MARKPKTERVWFESFDLEAEVTALITRIGVCTKFSLPAQKRDLAFSYAELRLRETKQTYADAKSQGKPVSTSRRDFLETIQDTIFLAIPAENVELMPISEYVLNDPSYYEAAMCRAASLTEDELFMALSPILKDMTVQDARDFVSKLWHDGIDDNARKYAEALKRPERECVPLRSGYIV
ncbi:hypothetical protein SAMN05444273_10924 [Litoreibacter ascidiaceicola]|uniref:Uncharacterized protein n=1 Tax=Litoreibacter ascidiaceicola TaxID=1486859 RepID=A0A1M5DFT5_9RHOB|nr:hypothetical protein [Litoreibacter ascidiaceicola]SHF65847.1 hypothetical protein SAMN05444273_10924 [Litoreibacter ascidiaceicola]